MSHPLCRHATSRRRFLPCSLLLLAALAASSAHASTVVRLKTNLGNIDLALFTDLTGDITTQTSRGAFPIFNRSGTLNSAVPFIEPFLAGRGNGMLFHNKSNASVGGGLVKLRDDRYKLIPPGGRGLYEPGYANDKGTLAMTYNVIETALVDAAGNACVEDPDSTPPVRCFELPAAGRGRLWRINTRDNSGGTCFAIRPDNSPSSIVAPLACSIVFGKVIGNGMEVVEAIGDLDAIHAFYGIDGALFEDADPRVAPRLASLPLLTNLVPPDIPIPAGCTPTPGNPLIPDLVSCDTEDAFAIWLDARRAAVADQVRDNAVRIEKFKVLPSLRGVERIQMAAPVVMAIADLNGVTSRAEWSFRMRNGRWSADDLRGNSYSGDLEPLGGDRFELVLDEESLAALLDTWVEDIDEGATQGMRNVLNQHPEEFRLISTLNENELPSADLVAVYERTPRMRATVDLDRKTVFIRGKAQIRGELQTTVHLFIPGEVTRRPETTTASFDADIQFSMTGRLRGRP